MISFNFPNLPSNLSVLPFTEKEKDPKFWNAGAQMTLKNALTLQALNKNKAQNLILFLGDGKPQHHYGYQLIWGRRVWNVPERFRLEGKLAGEDFIRSKLINLSFLMDRLLVDSSAEAKVYWSWSDVLEDPVIRHKMNEIFKMFSNMRDEWIVSNKTTVLLPDHWASVWAGTLIGHIITVILHRASALSVWTIGTAWHSCTLLHGVMLV